MTGSQNIFVGKRVNSTPVSLKLNLEHSSYVSLFETLTSYRSYSHSELFRTQLKHSLDLSFTRPFRTPEFWTIRLTWEFKIAGLKSNLFRNCKTSPHTSFTWHFLVTHLIGTENGPVCARKSMWPTRSSFSYKEKQPTFDISSCTKFNTNTMHMST